MYTNKTHVHHYEQIKSDLGIKVLNSQKQLGRRVAQKSNGRKTCIDLNTDNIAEAKHDFENKNKNL